MISEVERGHKMDSIKLHCAIWTAKGKSEITYGPWPTKSLIERCRERVPVKTGDAEKERGVSRRVKGHDSHAVIFGGKECASRCRWSTKARASNRRAGTKRFLRG